MARPRNAPPRSEPLCRLFDKTILAKARALAAQYKIIVESEDDVWLGHGLEIPAAFGDGRTVEAAVANTREALVTAVAYLLESGEVPPPRRATATVPSKSTCV